MTDKEKIASIAKDYANYLDPDDKCNRTMIEVDCIGFVEWLKEEFEIVAKEKIREEYNKIQQRIEENKILASHSEFYPEIERAETFVIMDEKQVHLLKSLFPQTLKSEGND